MTNGQPRSSSFASPARISLEPMPRRCRSGAHRHRPEPHAGYIINDGRAEKNVADDVVPVHRDERKHVTAVVTKRVDELGFQRLSERSRIQAADGVGIPWTLVPNDHEASLSTVTLTHEGVDPKRQWDDGDLDQ